VVYASMMGENENIHVCFAQALGSHARIQKHTIVLAWMSLFFLPFLNNKNTWEGREVTSRIIKFHPV